MTDSPPFSLPRHRKAKGEELESAGGGQTCVLESPPPPPGVVTDLKSAAASAGVGTAGADRRLISLLSGGLPLFEPGLVGVLAAPGSYLSGSGCNSLQSCGFTAGHRRHGDAGMTGGGQAPFLWSCQAVTEAGL